MLIRSSAKGKVCAPALPWYQIKSTAGIHQRGHDEPPVYQYPPATAFPLTMHVSGEAQQVPFWAHASFASMPSDEKVIGAASAMPSTEADSTSFFVVTMGCSFTLCVSTTWARWDASSRSLDIRGAGTTTTLEP
jgi:hypothetical protein